MWQKNWFWIQFSISKMTWFETQLLQIWSLKELCSTGHDNTTQHSSGAAITHTKSPWWDAQVEINWSCMTRLQRSEMLPPWLLICFLSTWRLTWVLIPEGLKAALPPARTPPWTTFSSQARPMTRYLPNRKEEFDLRAHVESSGHSVDTCPFVILTEKMCKGHLVKMGGKIKSWKKRWFVFDRLKRNFSYYVGEDMLIFHLWYEAQRFQGELWIICTMKIEWLSVSCAAVHLKKENWVFPNPESFPTDWCGSATFVRFTLFGLSNTDQTAQLVFHPSFGVSNPETQFGGNMAPDVFSVGCCV